MESLFTKPREMTTAGGIAQVKRKFQASKPGHGENHGDDAWLRPETKV